MHRYLLIPLLLGLILTQGFHRSASVCLDQLGHCAEVGLVEEAHSCPCGEDESAPTNTCSEDCTVCHLDHSDELFVFSGTSVERPQPTQLYAPRVVEILEPSLLIEADYIFVKQDAPPKRDIEDFYGVRLL